MSLSPEERILRARLAAFTKHSLYDPSETTKPARAASPGSLSYWERKVDPKGELSDAERRRRAECAKKAHFQRMAFESAKARRKGAVA
jgi:hypothetical protein